MRVENSPINPNVDATQSSTVAKSTPPSTDATAGSAGGSATETTSFSPTSDLVRLLNQVRQTPDTRPDVVDNVSSRLGSGEFSTTEAANAAATNLVDLSSNG